VRSEAPDRVARWMVVGLTIGLVGGLVLAAPEGGDALLKPLLVPLLGMLCGALVGAGVGVALGAWRGRDAEPDERPAGQTAFEPAAIEEPEPPIHAQDLAQPPPADDGSAAGPGWYPDPLDDTEQRFWDGDAWTGHTWRPRRRG
jgi:Protein of unknown function (DUF2510)